MQPYSDFIKEILYKVYSKIHKNIFIFFNVLNIKSENYNYVPDLLLIDGDTATKRQTWFDVAANTATKCLRGSMEPDNK